MKIIVVGLGSAGCALIKALAGENYDVTVIDKNKAVVDNITDNYNVNGIVGSGASKETLLKAGADTADALVALTHIDEINLLSCMQAKSLGTRRTATRILLPDFVNEAERLKKEYSIDYFVKPKSDIAEEISRNIGLPGFIKLEGFFGNAVQMINLSVRDDSPLDGKSLMEIKQSIQADIIVATVIRDGKLYVPDGTFVLNVDDQLGIITNREKLQDTLEKLKIKPKNVKKIAIVGGGITCEYLINMLKDEKKDITVYDNSISRCRELMEKYPLIKVSYAEGDVTEALEEEKIEKMDSLISVSNSDETNLVTSMFAWSQNVPSIITRVDKPGHVKLLHKVNMDITVSPTELSVLKMLRFIRNYEIGDAKNGVGKFYMIADGMAEVMEFTADKEFSRIGVEFKDKKFKLKKDIIVAAVIRGDKLVIPSGNTQIQVGDVVVVASSKKNHIRNLNEIIA